MKTKTKKKPDSSEITPWTFFYAISEAKQIDRIEADPEYESKYDPFIINKLFSKEIDTIIQANTMNRWSGLDPKMQFDYLRFSVRKKKRDSTWPKKLTEENIRLIQDYYQYTKEKAKEALEILTSAEIESIKLKFDRGGLKKQKASK